MTCLKAPFTGRRHVAPGFNPGWWGAATAPTAATPTAAATAAARS
jgi:hypothetical protein